METAAPNAEPSPTLPPVAYWLAGAVALCLGLMTVHFWIDRGQRTELEYGVAGTGVGDQEWAALPEMAQAEVEPAVVLRGTPLFAMSDKPHERKDLRMRLAGTDERAGKLRIYESEEEWRPRRKEVNRTGVATYWLKHAPGLYLRLQPK